MRLVKLLSACASFFLANTVHAAVIIDTDNLIKGSPFSGFYSGQPASVFPITTLYQTFTINNTGIFNALELTSGAGGNGNVYVDLFRGGNNSTPGTIFLGSITRQANSINNYGIDSFDFSPFNIAVTSGEVLTFKLSADSCRAGSGCTTFTNFNNSLTDTANGYGGGSFFINSGQGPIVSLQDDLSFRSSVSTFASVPEPATWALLILGFAATGHSLRRRKTGYGRPVVIGFEAP